MVDSTTKRCFTCKKEYPATVEHFHKSKRKSDGLHYDCKSCANAKARENTRKHGVKPYEPIRLNGLKRCCKCKTWKPETENYFHRESPRPGGFAMWCKDCCKQKWIDRGDKNRVYQSRYYQEHKDQRQIQDSEYRNRPEIKAIKRQKTQDWRENNRDRDRANATRWQKANPQRVKVRNERRRTRQKGLPDTLTPQEWQSCLDYFGGCCAICGRPPGLWHTIAMDHWIPLNCPTCPGTVAGNCIPLCHGDDGCNNSKHDLMPDEWLNWKFGKHKAKQILSRIEAYFKSLEPRN